MSSGECPIYGPVLLVSTHPCVATTGNIILGLINPCSDYVLILKMDIASPQM